MTQLSPELFLNKINGFSKESKELIDNSVETYNDGMSFSKVVSSVDTTEINEKFVSTVRESDPKKTPEGAQIAASASYTGYTTIVTPLPKTTDSITYSYEYMKGKLDSTQKIEKEYMFDVRKVVKGLYNDVNVEFFSLMNNGFTTTLSPDSEILYSAAHKFTDDLPTVTFDNLLAAAVPTVDVLDNLQERAGAFVDPGGIPMSLNPQKLVVKRGGKAFREFKKIIMPERYQPALLSGTNDGVNIYEGEYTMVETPYIATSNEYHFMENYEMSTLRNPLYLGFHDRPTIHSSKEYTDTMTHITGFVTYYKRAVVNIPIGMYGSVGA